MELKRFGQYCIVSQCGEGATSIVYNAFHSILQLPVALKIIKKVDMPEKCLQNIKREVELMKDFDNEHIISFYEVIEDEDELGIAMEAAPNGSLANLFSTNKFMSREQIWQIIKQVAEALSYLHTEKHVIHRDIKVENILFDEHMKVKLSDFGLSVTSTDSKNTRCGSPLYASPEMVKGDKYDEKTDIWSFGILVYFLSFGNFPFFDQNIAGLYDKIIFGDVEFPKNANQSLVDLISNCLEKDPEERFSIENVLSHDYMKVSLQSLPSLQSQLNCNNRCFNRVIKNENPKERIYSELSNRLGQSKSEIIELLEKDDSDMKTMYRILKHHYERLPSKKANIRGSVSAIASGRFMFSQLFNNPSIQINTRSMKRQLRRG